VTLVAVDPAVQDAKRALRAKLLGRRAQRPPAERLAAAEALRARACALPEVLAASRLACYASAAEEPGTQPLLATLSTRACTVLLPLLQTDFDLDWAAYEPGSLREARFGIDEPAGPPLGADAVLDVSVVILPGLAADDLGHRLGRGGGSYDRVLARLPAGVLRVVLLYDDEVLSAVPVDAHDQPVDVVVAPSCTMRTRAGRPPGATRPS